MAYSTIDHLECSKCHKKHSADQLINICDCGYPLVVHYDLKLAQKITSKADIAKRDVDMWRYHELLPILHPKDVVTLGEGFSPLLKLNHLQKEFGLDHLYVKYEGSNVGGTFKARGASCGLSKAKELGAKKVAITTNGNAGEAWAMYAARGQVPIVVIMPTDAQEVTKMICQAVGAETYLIRGMISDGGKYIEKHKEARGWFDVSTLKEPYRLEGKKTITFEIIEQLGWKFPDVIIFPTGGGISIAAAYKACMELKELGWVEGKLPRLVAVQAQGCAPLEKAFLAKEQYTQFFEGAHTKANGLRVPKPFCDFMVLEAIYKSHGCAISVSDDEMLEGIKKMGQSEGLFLCPEAGACILGLKKLKDHGLIHRHETVVFLGSGSGLKYRDLFQTDQLEVIDAIK